MYRAEVFDGTTTHNFLCRAGATPLPAPLADCVGEGTLILARDRGAIVTGAAIARFSVGARLDGARPLAGSAWSLKVHQHRGKPVAFVDEPTQGRRPKLPAVEFAVQTPDGTSTPLSSEIVLAGRHPESDIQIPDPRMSAVHLGLLADESGVLLFDLGSRNGTYLSGNRIDAARVERSSRLLLGDTPLLLQRRSGNQGTVEMSSESMKEVYELLNRASPAEVPIVILGESGVGKDVVARRIHDQSGRTGPFVSINCASIGPNLSASELFGHVRGSFTGADRDHAGAFRAAEGGTLFLDEIGELPLAVQAELLRAVETRSVRPVGAHHELSVDTRIVAATNRDLTQMVASRKFREDLFHRLCVITVTLPPLRERVEDITELANHFLSTLPVARRLTLRGHRKLRHHSWPGNVRELRHAISRAAVTSDKLLLDSPDLVLPKPVKRATCADDLIHDIIVDTYDQLGSIAATARELGMRRSVVHHHLKLHRSKRAG